MVKAIIFDFWGTLVENGIWSPIKQVRNILGINLLFSEYVIRMEKAMMTLPYDKLKEAFESVCREFNLECEQQKMEQLIGIWNKSWMLAEPYKEVVETLTELKKKYQLILVANTDPFSVNKVLEKFDLKGLFNKTYFSYEMGLIKTDNGFLKHILSELDLRIEDCIMVGDSIHSDIIAAKRLGIPAILIDRRNTRDFHPKIKNLKELENVLRL